MASHGLFRKRVSYMLSDVLIHFTHVSTEMLFQLPVPGAHGWISRVNTALEPAGGNG
ncbi:hypothetical protein R70211_00964 [Paraburkholderia domus]|uniref:Uncharacterized protein n=1 Tax=Paraburkholderia domus TaxID=2793075 RepID=A0A9N8MLD4_9BURK|nr:hypothetical protein R70211_00964 [Paraburkholderia domus]